MVKNIIIFLLFCAVFATFFLYFQAREKIILNPVDTIKKNSTELNKYTFESLRKRVFKPDQITFGKMVTETPEYTSRIFYYMVDGKKVSGLAHIPKNATNVPIIIQIRGFVPTNIYQPGVGTQHSAEAFAKNGYISLAPDFLGFAESDPPAADALEERFQTYTTALQLLASVKSINTGLSTAGISTTADTSKIGVWGHSNGGHIALSVMEISGASYPTVLWAPVSKPFPFSVLYFTDEFEDNGKALRKVIADFEQDYNIENFSFNNFYDWIQAPLQIHQGSADEAVPQKWSDQLVQALQTHKKSVEYFVYPGEDHNFANGSWSKVMQSSIDFFNKNVKNK